MMTNRLLLCVDMDRTIIPNGRQVAHPDAHEHFCRLCQLVEIELAYVTGRHLQLVKQAIAEYSLPEPDYAVTDVGTKIYQKSQNSYNEILLWQDQIARDWRGKSHLQLQQALQIYPELELQEQSKQNDYKLSYYLPLNADRKSILKKIEDQLDICGVSASLVMSVDEPEQVALLDILPRNATKLHAIEFLGEYQGYGQDEIIFAGDSGNDLQVLGSSIRSVLVANAEAEIKIQARQLAKANGTTKSLYLAQDDGFFLGGNYTAGVLQGVVFYVPELIKILGLP